MARKHTEEFLIELGLNAEERSRICHALQKEASPSAIRDILVSTDFHTKMAELMKALFYIKGGSTFELGQEKIKTPSEIAEVYALEREMLRRLRKK